MRLVLMWICGFYYLGEAQFINWTKQTGTSSYDYGSGVIASADGRFIYVTGYAYGSLNGQTHAGDSIISRLRRVQIFNYASHLLLLLLYLPLLYVDDRGI